jgi:carbon starvation protein
LVTFGWGILIHTGSIDTIWPMFGIANQLLAVIAMCVLTTLLINQGKARYAPVTLLPMLFVTATTMTAGAQMIRSFSLLLPDNPLKWTLNIALTVFVITCVALLLLIAVARWVAVLRGIIPIQPALATAESTAVGLPPHPDEMVDDLLAGPVKSEIDSTSGEST